MIQVNGHDYDPDNKDDVNALYQMYSEGVNRDSVVLVQLLLKKYPASAQKLQEAVTQGDALAVIEPLEEYPDIREIVGYHSGASWRGVCVFAAQILKEDTHENS